MSPEDLFLQRQQQQIQQDNDEWLSSTARAYRTEIMDSGKKKTPGAIPGFPNWSPVQPSSVRGSQPPAAETPSTLRKLLGEVARISLGTADAGAALGSGLIAWPASSAVGLRHVMGGDPEKGVKEEERVANALTWQPRTPEGARAMETIGNVLNLMTYPTDKLSEWYEKMTGSKDGAYYIKKTGQFAIPALIPMLIGAKNLRAKGAKEATGADLREATNVDALGLQADAAQQARIILEGSDLDQVTPYFKDNKAITADELAAVAQGRATKLAAEGMTKEADALNQSAAKIMELSDAAKAQGMDLSFQPEVFDQAARPEANAAGATGEARANLGSMTPDMAEDFAGGNSADSLVVRQFQDDIKKILPGTEVIAYGDGAWDVITPNGKKFEINFVDRIELTPEQKAQMATDYGRPIDWKNEYVKAQFKFGELAVDSDGIILLTKPSSRSLSHEVFHAAHNLILLPEEQAVLVKHFGNEEAAARAYAEFLKDGPSVIKNADVRTSFQKIKDFFTSIYNNLVHGQDLPKTKDIFNDIKSGEVWKRGAEAVDEMRTKAGVAPDAPIGPEVFLPADQLYRVPKNHELRSMPEVAADVMADTRARIENIPEHSRVKKTGLYVGSPKDLNINTPEKLASYRKDLLQLTKEGLAQKDWYEKSGKAFLTLAHDNMERAFKFIQQIAVYSPQTDTWLNMDFAHRAFLALVKGEPFSAGIYPNKMVPLSTAVFREGKQIETPKQKAFIANLMHILDEARFPAGPVTVDMWVMRAFGFKKVGGGPTAQQYAFMEREIQQIANELDIKPHQAQAALWTAVKSRWEMAEPALKQEAIAKGLSPKKTSLKEMSPVGKYVRDRIMDGAKKIPAKDVQAYIDANGGADFAQIIKEKGYSLDEIIPPEPELFGPEKMQYLLSEKKGFSLRPDKDSPQEGFVVSRPGFSKVFEKDPTPDEINAWIKEHAPVIEKNPDLYYGGWRDMGKTYLDLSEVFKNEADAAAATVQRGELSYYDVAKDEAVFPKVGTHYGKAGYDALRAPQSAKDIQRYSREKARQIEAGEANPEYPYIPTTDVYVGNATPEEIVKTGKTPYRVVLPKEMYDLTKDPMGLKGEAKQIVADSDTPGDLGFQKNVLHNLIQQSGYEGYMAEVRNGEWQAYVFGKSPKGEMVFAKPEKAASAGSPLVLRPLGEIARDLATLLKLDDERGAIGDLGQMSPEKQAVYNRLKDDFSRIAMNAARKGQSIRDYLVEMGVNGDIAGLLEKEAMAAAQESSRESKKATDATGKPTATVNDVAGLSPDELKQVRTNLDYVVADEATKRIMGRVDQLAQATGQMEKAVRGVVHDVDAIKKAEGLLRDGSMSIETIMKRKPGEIWPEEKTLAARFLRDTLYDQYSELLNRAEAGDPAALAEYKTATALLADVHTKVQGLASEGGRLLRSQQIMSKGREFDALMGELSETAKLINDSGISDPVLISRLKALKDKQVKMDFVGRWVEGLKKGVNIFYELWYAALLSGPKTHLVNFTSNTMTLTLGPMERALGEGYGMVAKKLGAEDYVVRGETAAMMRGFVHGFMDSMEAAWKALAEQEQTFGKSKKIEVGPEKGINAEYILGDKWPNAKRFRDAIDLVGDVVGGPGRALMAADEMFKGLNYYMELEAQAYRDAYFKGKRGQAMAEHVAKILEDPPAKIAESAREYAAMQTFTNELGPAGKNIQAAVNDFPPARLILPFIQTPTNILKYTWARTPGLNLVSARFWSDIAKGGSARDLAMAKMTMGGMIMATVVYMAANDMITGAGPINRNMKKQWLDQGNQEYSIRLGDKSYSYNRLDPVGNVLAIGATYATLVKLGHIDEANEMAAAAMFAVSDVMVNKTYMKGLNDVLQAIKDPNTQAIDYAKTWTKSLVPSAVGQIKNVQDPLLREADTVMEGIQSRVPWWSESLPPVRDPVFADPVMANEAGLWGLISPLNPKTMKVDPVRAEILRQGVVVSPMDKRLGGTKQSENPLVPESLQWGVKLSPEQYDRLQVMAAKEIKIDDMTLHEYLDDMIKSDFYKMQKDGPDGGKATILKSIINRFRTQARLAMEGGDKALGDEIELRRRKRTDAKLPAGQRLPVFGR